MTKYPGQKKIYGVYHKIINNIPKHRYYYEPFLGSGAISTLLGHAVNDMDISYCLSDINPEVINKFSNSYKGRFWVTVEPALNVLKSIKNIVQEQQNNLFTFLDPPYLHSTRPNNTQLYKYEMTDADHIQLLETVLQLKCNVMIIHPRCELYDMMLKDWRQVEIKIRYNRKTSIDCLYMNYPEQELQTTKYLGTDCWDRQRIKRKKTALLKKLEELPLNERKLLIDEINLKFK